MYYCLLALLLLCDSMELQVFSNYRQRACHDEESDSIVGVFLMNITPQGNSLVWCIITNIYKVTFAQQFCGNIKYFK